MANRMRGEVPVVIGGQARRLCLTFGALAEIETELGVADAFELGARLRRLSSTDLWVVVGALLRGAGQSEAPLVSSNRADIAGLAAAVAEAFREAGE
jgi:hypothetical protein